MLDLSYAELHTLLVNEGEFQDRTLGKICIYDDDKIRILGDVLVNEVHIVFYAFYVYLRLPGTIMPESTPKFGIDNQKGNITQVLKCVVRKTGDDMNLLFPYYRPGKWVGYVKKLAEKALRENDEWFRMNSQPVDDERLFS